MISKHPRSKVVVIVILIIIGVLITKRGLSSSDMKVGLVDSSITAPAVQLSKAFATISDYVRPAVVSVFSEKIVKFGNSEFPLPFEDDFFRRFFRDPIPNLTPPNTRQREYSIPQKGMGSGIIIDKLGHILTNYHVVGNVDKIKVLLAGKATYNAKVTQVDPKTDIAIIQLQGKFPKDLSTVVFGDSDALRAGDLVIAVGAPFGLPQTVTQGIVSATGRANVGIEDYEDFIQTDTPINPGNSGGPLINMNGEVIGINTAIATAGSGQSSGVGFSVPSNLVKLLLPTLLKGEKITRGKLGIIIQNLNDQLAEQFNVKENSGVLIADVQSGSAAQNAGLKTGDIILKYENKDVSDTAELRNLVAATAPGKEVKISILRNGKLQSITAEVDKDNFELSAAEKINQHEGNTIDRIGISIHDIDESVSKAIGIQKGVLVADVIGGSPASMAGIEPNDIIVEANHKVVKNAKELLSILENSKNKDSVLFLIKRQNASLFVAIQLR
ncbi:MAG: Do family serine endopeptidase [Pseudobdellovibrio sp.]